jgi:iron complex outermembrane receptor protein
VGYQQNRRQEFEESAREADLDFRLQTVNYDVKYISGDIDGWKWSAGAGGMLQQSENLGEEVLIPSYRLADAGLFTTVSKSFQKLHLTGGIRGDIRLLHSFALEDKFVEFQRSFPGLTGSIGLVYSPVPSLNLRANLARGFRAPNLSELASNGVHEGTVRYEKGKPDLRPEFSLQGDLGADFSNKYLSASAALFCNRIQNYIFASRTADVTEGHPVYQYSADNALLYGGELSLDIHPVHRLHLNSQFSFVRGTFGQENMPLIPAPRLSGEIKWELSHGGKVFDDSYLAFRADHCFPQNNFLPGTETATEAYTLLGLSAASDILVRGRRIATIHLIADNLLDTVYSDHLNRLKYVGLHNPGRNITIKLDFVIQ